MAFRPAWKSKRFGFLLVGATDKSKIPAAWRGFYLGRTKMSLAHF